MVDPILFDDYDKITDLVYELGSKTLLELVVTLSRKNEKTNDRYHYHKEFKYESRYCQHKLASIKRSFDYYLILSKFDVKGSGVMIRVQDMYLILNKFNEALKWFTSGIYGKRKSNELYIKETQSSILIPGLPAQKYIQLDPIVIVWENTGAQSQGIRITLGDPSVFSDVTIDRFYGLVYILGNLDLYGCAQNMINYLQRPEYGTNLKEFENNKFLEMSEPIVEKDNMTVAKNNRSPASVNNTRPKTFFDKIDGIK